jgi:hypothetical protein
MIALTLVPSQRLDLLLVPLPIPSCISQKTIEVFFLFILVFRSFQVIPILEHEKGPPSALCC